MCSYFFSFSIQIAKPIMEKKRRARINASLNELKALLVEVLQKEVCDIHRAADGHSYYVMSRHVTPRV